MKNVSLELHLSSSPDLPKKFGAKIKAVGGRYSECRGNAYKRFVHVPVEAIDLANELIKTFPIGKSTCLIWRGPEGPAKSASTVVTPDWEAETPANDAVKSIFDTRIRRERESLTEPLKDFTALCVYTVEHFREGSFEGPLKYFEQKFEVIRDFPASFLAQDEMGNVVSFNKKNFCKYFFLDLRDAYTNARQQRADTVKRCREALAQAEKELAETEEKLK